MAAFAEHTAAQAVVAVPGFAAFVRGHLFAGRVDLAAFEDGTVVAEADASEEGIAGEDGEVSAAAQVAVEAGEHRERPVFAVAVEHDGAVAA